MRKALMASVASIALLSGTPAFADVTVTAEIEKDKTITVNELISIIKTVTLTATVTATAGKFAEADAIVNQSNFNNTACENCAEKTDTIGGTGTGTGTGAGGNAVSNNSGTVSVNQSAGNFNNQGNAISAAVDDAITGGGGTTPGGTGVGFAEANASVEQINGGSNSPDPTTTVTDGTSDPAHTILSDGNTVNSVNIVFRTATIQNAINNNTGVVQVNQSPGQMNNQNNSLALAFSVEPGGVALSEADLGQFNVNNNVFESDGVVGNTPQNVGVTKTALITGSINHNIGVVGVNQSSGNMANQANIVAVAAVRTP